jgi:tetratricopeptide (TPR) repeat protein
MRAIIQWLVLAPLLLVFLGCQSIRSLPSPVPSGSALSGADRALAEALAHYSQALIAEATLGESQAGVFHFRQAAASDPSYLPLNLKVAMDCLARKDYPGAAIFLNQTAKRHPDSVEVQLLSGTVFQAQGKTREAFRAFRAAIRLAPDRPEGYVRLATLQVVSLATRDALSVIDSGLARVKDKTSLLEFCETVGRIYLAGQDVANASLFFERIRRQSPERDEIREALGRCYIRLERNREAMTEYEALLKKHPGSSPVLMLLGGLYEEAGELDRAREFFQRATTGIPPEPQAFIRLASLQSEKNGEAAVKILDEAIARFPADVRVRVVQALLLMQRERYAEAVSRFEWVDHAIERDETAARLVQPFFYLWYGGACERAGRPADAERLVKKYLALNPDSPEALNTLAYLWAEQGQNLDQAMDFITRALQQEPDNGAYRDTLGWIHYKKGNPALALENLTLALKKEGDDPTILEHIGDTWLALKRQDKALRMWWKSIRLNPGNKGLRAKMIREGVSAAALPPSKEPGV